MIPGKKPASAIPSSARTTKKLVSPPMNAMAPEHTPQVNMIRAIHLLAPTRSRNKLDGTSKKKYARKKMPAPKPKAEADRPRSLFMVSAAKPTLTRSR